MRPLRVSFVIDTLSRAGTETQLLALIRNLDRKRVEPTLILLDGTDALSQSLEPRDCDVIRLGVRRLASRRAFAAAGELRRHWRHHRPDIVQAYFMDSAYLAIPVAKFCGVPRVVRVRNNLGYWLTIKHKIMNRLLRPFVDVTLTNSEAGRDQLLRERVGRVHVIENGVDLSAPLSPLRGEGLEVWGGPARRLAEIIAVANLRPVKNIDGLLRAAAIVVRERPDAHFRIAGDGPERAALETLRESLALTDHVTFHGSVADIPTFLSTGALAVLPSHSEGMSNALLEMMAAGCAVVATDVGANARVLTDSGIVVPPKDDAALAAVLLDLLKDPDRVRRLGNAARERVEACFSRAAMCRKFEEFYGGLSKRTKLAGRTSDGWHAMTPSVAGASGN